MDNGACSYRRFLEGDESAFDEIMNELFYKLVFFINRYVRNTCVAEDIAMDVFSDLIVNKRRYNFKISLKSYLFMLGRSRAIDYLRREKLSFYKNSQYFELNSSDVELEEHVIKDEKMLRVNQAISELSKDMRVVIHLIYFEEMSYADAGKIMKKSAKQIDNLLYRAKKILREILGEYGDGSL